MQHTFAKARTGLGHFGVKEGLWEEDYSCEVHSVKMLIKLRCWIALEIKLIALIYSGEGG